MTRPDFAPTQIDFVHRDDLPASDVGHGPLADYVRGLGTVPVSRSNACGQDPRHCPTPDACLLVNDDDPQGIGVIRGLIWGLGLTFGAIALAALAAAFWPWSR
jgi:hypothetical protein